MYFGEKPVKAIVDADTQVNIISESFYSSLHLSELERTNTGSSNGIH